VALPLRWSSQGTRRGCAQTQGVCTGQCRGRALEASVLGACRAGSLSLGEFGTGLLFARGGVRTINVHHDLVAEIDGFPFSSVRFDVEFPEEVDDEFWENEAHPEQAFVQPQGKPSLVAAFNARIKLSQILAFALRTVGASDKSKSLLGLTGRGWKEKVVTELNSALTEWVKSIPEHREF
jgi:hypothetical protein